MDHLVEARVQLSSAEQCDYFKHTLIDIELFCKRAQVHALIDIAESLRRLADRQLLHTSNFQGKELGSDAAYSRTQRDYAEECGFHDE